MSIIELVIDKKQLELLDTLRKKKFSRVLNAVRNSIIKTLNSDNFSAEVHDYLKSMHPEAEGVPFTDFADEPDQISQIKKLINSLYHGEQALLDTEKVNLHERSLDALFLYKHTVPHVYKACYLATHFDINLAELFSKEVGKLAPLITTFQEYAQSYGEETKRVLLEINPRDIPHKAGVVSGMVVDQLGTETHSGVVDYEFLTQFSGDLSGYLDQFDGYIKKFSATVSKHQPTIDKKKLDQLQDHALKLLHSLNQVHGGGSLQTLNYVRIIRHTIILSMSIIKQVGHLTDSSQDLAREKLSEFKYELLPQLFGFVDKIEAHAMLKPGFISTPLMASVSNLYKSLIYYTSKFVDFSVKGQGLVTVEDGRFIAARLEHTYERSAEDKKVLFEIAQAQKASDAFFAILNTPKYRNKRILELPDDIKQTLASHYKIMQPYFLQFDIPSNNLIIGGFTRRKGLSDILAKPFRNLGSAQHTDRIKNIRLLQKTFDERLAKARVTHEFYIKLNDDIITSVSNEVQALSLFSHEPNIDPFALNEAVILGMDPEKPTTLKFLPIAPNNKLLDNVDKITSAQLTSAQAINLYQFYQKKDLKLESAQQAYNEFHKILNSAGQPQWLSSSPDNIKNKLRNLYAVFQPYLVKGISTTIYHVGSVEKLDELIVRALNSKAGSKPVIETTPILALNTRMQACFDAERERLQKRADVISTLAQSLIQQENQTKQLVQDSRRTARADHVLKSDHYAQAIAEFRTSLYKLTLLFNESIQAQLNPAKKGLPFPELEDANKTIEQSEQVLVIKRLFNSLYHVEEISRSLQELRNDSSELEYVSKVALVGDYFLEITKLMGPLVVHPVWSMIATDVKEKQQNLYAALMKLDEQYSPEPLKDETIVQSTKHTVIAYTLNIAMVLPEHIKALRGNKELSSATTEAIHQHAEKVTVDIERILDKSNSYFKLFFEIPTMYRLFRELKQKLADFTAVSQGAVLDNLSTINTVHLTKLLIEADRWEDKFGLKPGTITKTLKEILDTYYQGLLDPLGLPSQRHIALVQSLVPIDERLVNVTKRQEKAVSERDAIGEKLKIVQQLVTSIRHYHKSKTTSHKAAMLADFKLALPILKQEHKHFDSAIVAGHGHQTLDALLNSADDHEPKLTNIEALTVMCGSYLQGLYASKQLTIDTVGEKKAYLNKLKIEQLDLNVQFVERYTKASFKRQAADSLATPVGLIHCDTEYTKELAAYLQEAEPNIIGISQKAEDINRAVAKHLQEKVEAFEHQYYKSYYHLDSIREAIARLESYVHKSNKDIQRHRCLFESVGTLKEKKDLIRVLKGLATNDKASVAQRLIEIKEVVEKRTFETTLLHFHRHDRWTWAWLKQCIVSLIELIGLYTPERQKCYSQLAKSVEPPSNITKFSMFAKHTKKESAHERLHTFEGKMPRPV